MNGTECSKNGMTFHTKITAMLTADRQLWLLDEVCSSRTSPSAEDRFISHRCMSMDRVLQQHFACNVEALPNLVLSYNFNVFSKCYALLKNIRWGFVLYNIQHNIQWNYSMFTNYLSEKRCENKSWCMRRYGV